MNGFLETKLVKPTRRIGKAVFYTYNIHSHAGKALRDFYLDLVFKEAEKEAGVKKRVAALAQ